MKNGDVHSNTAEVSALPPALMPFERTLADPVARALTLRTLAWATNQGVLDKTKRRAEVLVLVASVYAKLCAPPHPSERSLDIAARFTFLFFLIDDAEPSELSRFVSDTADWSVGPLTTALRAWMSELPELESCPAQLRASFNSSFRAYLRARRLEPSLVSGKLSLEEHWKLRRETIFMDPYLDHWMISTGIDTSGFRLEDFSAARRLGTDIVLLSNDLGSVERDRKGGDSPEDLNLVDAYQELHACSREEAIRGLIGDHNQLVRRFRAALAAALGDAPSSAASAYAELLCGVVDGNLASLHALDFRYRNVEHLLKQLEQVTPV